MPAKFFAVQVRINPYERAIIHPEGGVSYEQETAEFGWLYADAEDVDPALEALAMRVRAELFR